MAIVGSNEGKDEPPEPGPVRDRDPSGIPASRNLALPGLSTSSPHPVRLPPVTPCILHLVPGQCGWLDARASNPQPSPKPRRLPAGREKRSASDPRQSGSYICGLSLSLARNRNSSWRPGSALIEWRRRSPYPCHARAGPWLGLWVGLCH